MASNWQHNSSAVISSVLAFLQYVEPCLKSKPVKLLRNDSTTKQLICRTKVEVDAFFPVIDNSLNWSDAAIDICRDVLDLDDFLADGKLSFEALKEFLEEIREKTRRAYSQAREDTDQLSFIDDSLYEIYQNSICEQQYAEKQDGRKPNLKLTEIVSKLIGRIVCVALSAAWSPTFSRGQSISLLAILQPRKAFHSQLKEIHTRVAEIQTEFSRFVNIWKDIEDSIATINDSLLSGGPSEARRHLIKKDWHELKKTYTTYNDQFLSEMKFQFLPG